MLLPRTYNRTILAVLLACLPILLACQKALADGQSHVEVAIFAGGCFWCTESDFEKVTGVLKAESGYIGGEKKKPNYRQVSSGGTRHTEAVRIEYNPKVVDYQTLLKVYWHSIDPLAKDRQFCDKGRQYRSGIFYLNDQQQRWALESKNYARAELDKRKQEGKIHTEITPANTFWLAEDYHQDYYKKNPIRYKWYRTGCGRDARLKALWDKQANWKP